MPESVDATHIVGGDLRYRCLGNNLYEIRLTMRRDCFNGAPNAQFDDPASIGIFDLQSNALLVGVGTNGQLQMSYMPDDTLDQEFISDCTIAGNDVCVHQTTYVDTIQLPFRPTGYLLSYQRCCRNNTLQNIVEPLGTGMTLTASITALAQQECNSSPVFGDYPPIYICANEPLQFGFTAIDVDGDSLVFELFTPFEGATITSPQPQPPPQPPYEQVVWADPYSLDNLLGGVPLTIDSETGFMTGIPNTIGQFLAGVRVTSYRNGEVIDVTTREWQYNVRICRDVPVSAFEIEESLLCDELAIDVTNLSEEELDVLWIFDYGNPDSDTSTQFHIDYQYPESGFYQLALIVTDPDSICFDTLVQNIGVFQSDIDADFELNVVECGDSIVLEILDLSVEPDVNFEVSAWEWYFIKDGDTLGLSDIQDPTFVIDTSTEDLVIVLTVYSENGCSATTIDTFDLNIIQIPFETVGIDSIGVCEGESVLLFPFPGNPEFSYTWEPTEGLDLTEPHNPTASPTETTEYFVTVTDGLCEVIGDVVVVVQDTPMLAFDLITDCRSLEVQTVNNSTGGFLFSWNFGDGTSLDTANNPSHTYAEPGDYIVTLSSADGCNVVSQDVLTVSVILDSLDNTAISCFAAPIEINPDGDGGQYGYEWSPSDGLSSDTIANPTAEVDETTTFYVTITDNEFPGCSVVDSIVVTVPEDFELMASPDSAYCDAPEVTLTGGNENLGYVWTDVNGEILGEDNVLVVQPEDTTSYILTGTDLFGCQKTDTITLAPTYFAIEVSPGPEVTICPGEDTVISIVNLDPNQMLDYVWQPSDCIIGPNDVPDPRVMPESDKVFTVMVTNDALGCTAERTIRVNVSDFDYEITPEALICLDESIEISITNMDTTVLNYLWGPDDGSIIDGIDTATPTVKPEVTTTYYVDILNTNFGCMTRDSVTVTVSWFDPPDLEVFYEPDSIIANDGEFILSTNQDDDNTFMWEGEGIENPTLPVVTAAPSMGGMPVYCVTVTNADGCMVSACSPPLTVEDPFCDERDIFLPNAFSPNGDGENDVLKVYSNFATSFELYIYNRWGELVFETQDVNGEWDGTFRGTLLPPDVFGYYMRVTCPPDKMYSEQGNITLLR